MRLLRDCAVALASAAVVAFLVVYAVSRPTVRLEAAVSGVERHPGAQAVLQGRVRKADGDGIADAEIRVRRTGAKTLIVRSSERGYFRVDLGGACAASRIDLAVEADGEHVRTTVRRGLCPGEALQIDARVVATGQLIWIPAS